jgi:hypothetical protein
MQNYRMPELKRRCGRSRVHVPSLRIVCVAAAIVLALSSVATAEIIDRVLAVVSGDLIMLSDVEAVREFKLVDVSGAADPVEAALLQLIDRALILDEVDRYAPPEPGADQIDRAFAGVRAVFPSAEAFATALARVGSDEARLRATLRQNLRLQAYLDQRFAADTPERSRAMTDEWVAGLRRRAEIVRYER